VIGNRTGNVGLVGVGGLATPLLWSLESRLLAAWGPANRLPFFGFSVYLW